MKTGFVWDELYAWHDTKHYAGVLEPDPALFIEPDEHHENPKTKRRFKNLLDASGFIKHLNVLEAKPADMNKILRVHTPDYIKSLEELSDNNGGDAGGLTPFSKGGFDIAKLSAGGCLALLDAVMTGAVKNGYALNRPPGHHAEADTGMGFCLLSNGSIVARSAIADHGAKRVAIVDWDVHHGNGPEKIFWDSGDVLTISIHQDNCFPPDSGPVEAIGAGEGIGCNLNIPLPPGSGRGAYLEAFDKVVIPALHKFNPDIILVASGFDGSGYDPLGRNMLYGEIYGKLTALLMKAADELCGGKLMMTHEGGYSAMTVPFCGLKVLETLSQIDSGVVDPVGPLIAGMGWQALQPHQANVIRGAAENLRHVPDHR
ncbi:MAG: class II histone deacetylase [Litorimonas sp.]